MLQMRRSVSKKSKEMPFIMNKAILMFCVLFCASSMNLKIPTNSDLCVSLMEQFSGRKPTPSSLVLGITVKQLVPPLTIV